MSAAYAGEQTKAVCNAPLLLGGNEGANETSDNHDEVGTEEPQKHIPGSTGDASQRSTLHVQRSARRTGLTYWAGSDARLRPTLSVVHEAARWNGRRRCRSVALIY